MSGKVVFIGNIIWSFRLSHKGRNFQVLVLESNQEQGVPSWSFKPLITTFATFLSVLENELRSSEMQSFTD